MSPIFHVRRVLSNVYMVIVRVTVVNFNYSDVADIEPGIKDVPIRLNKYKRAKFLRDVSSSPMSHVIIADLFVWTLHFLLCKRLIALTVRDVSESLARKSHVISRTRYLEILDRVRTMNVFFLPFTKFVVIYIICQ